MPPSLQARIFASLIRLTLRRRRWGADAAALARRARRRFGAPPLWGRLRARGLCIEPWTHGPLRGEWLIPAREPIGTLLYLHGGGFVSCSAARHRPITAGLARRGPFRVLAPDYRLAPEHPFPAGLDDVTAAYLALLEAGADPGRLAVAGDSAGGGLVLSLLVRLRDRGVPLPAAALCLSPWTDLTGSGASVGENDGRCAMFRPSNLTEFASAYLGAASPDDPEASPLFADLRGLPPVLLQVARDELLRDDARRVHVALERSELVEFDGVFHGWHMLDGLVPEAAIALDLAAAFLRERMGAR